MFSTTFIEKKNILFCHYSARPGLALMMRSLVRDITDDIPIFIYIIYIYVYRTFIVY